MLFSTRADTSEGRRPAGEHLPNDHPPPHVHVFKAGDEALFFLNCPSGPPTLREDYGFGERELKQIREALKPYITDLCAKWEEIHGNKR